MSYIIIYIVLYLIIGIVVTVDNWIRSCDLRLSNIGTIFVGVLVWPVVLIETLCLITDSKWEIKDKILIKRRSK